MIIYNNKGNPYGLKIKICLKAAGSNIKYEELTPEGMCKTKQFQFKSMKKRELSIDVCFMITISSE